MKRCRDHSAGVTLLETMIALAVMAFLAVLLASGMGTGARVMGRSGDIAAKIDAGLARYTLRTALEHGLASPFPDQAGGGLSGTASELVFYSVPDDGMFWPGVAVRVSLRNSPEGGISVETTGLSDIGQRETSHPLVIASDQTQATISYWGRARPAEWPRWHASWSADAGLPDLVKIAFLGTEPSIPAMIVRPGKAFLQSEMSLSSLLPPALPSRP